MIGTGKYSEVLKILLTGLEPSGVCGLLLVVGSVDETRSRLEVEIEAPPIMLRVLPEMLRKLATEIERDTTKGSGVVQ